jgi:hypothetical protein
VIKENRWTNLYIARGFEDAIWHTGDILGRKDARNRKQVQPFHIFDLPTNLDTGFYEYDQPLIELTAQHAQTE